MNRSSLSFLPAASLALALLTSASSAFAEDPLPCDFPNDPTYRCFKSDTVTVSKTSANIPFDNGLSTGWLNCEVPDGDKTPCGIQPSFNCSTVGVCLEVAMSDSKLDLAMQHQWDVYWPQVGFLQMIPRKPIKEGGTFNFTYKLSPTFSFLVDVLSPKLFFTVDPTQILKAVDPSGTIKEFDSSASGSCKFSPFAFDPPVACAGQAKPGQLFEFDFADIGLDLGQVAQISLSLDAATTDVVFSWQTDEISVKGGDMPVTKSNSSTSIPYTGGSEVSAVIQAKGKLSYSGATSLYPTVHIKNIGGTSIGFNWSFDVGANLPFNGTIPISLNPTTANILLPDLTVIASLNSAGAVDFGEVLVGEQKTKTISLKNFGAINAVGETISSQAGDFKVAKGNYDLSPDAEEKVEITFIPKKEGKVEATIFFNSNDPDQPEQTVKVTGFGKVPEDPGSGGSSAGGSDAGGSDPGTAGSSGKKPNLSNPTTEETSTDGGCGCRAAGQSGPEGAAPLALLALVGLCARRRRS